LHILNVILLNICFYVSYRFTDNNNINIFEISNYLNDYSSMVA